PAPRRRRCCRGSSPATAASPRAACRRTRPSCSPTRRRREGCRLRRSADRGKAGHAGVYDADQGRSRSWSLTHTKGTAMTDAQTAQLAINTIRTLSIDAVQAANSGHPGTPMALAPLVYTLWNRVMRFDPKDPIWPNRDRFVLSNGHASMLLWSVLHLTGVETTTGPLGQGIATSVGMAIARKWLAARYNKPGFEIFDYDVYAVCGDGCLMEGVGSEAASL